MLKDLRFQPEMKGKKALETSGSGVNQTQNGTKTNINHNPRSSSLVIKTIKIDNNYICP